MKEILSRMLYLSVPFSQGIFNYLLVLLLGNSLLLKKKYFDIFEYMVILLTYYVNIYTSLTKTEQ